MNTHLRKSYQTSTIRYVPLLFRTLDDDIQSPNTSPYNDIVRGSLFHKIEDGTLGYGSIPTVNPPGFAPRCIPKWSR